MPDSLNRRDFLAAGASAGAALAFPTAARAAAPASHKGAARTIVIASGNGHEFRNADGRTCVELAWERITAGSDVLDAVIAGVNIVERDPRDTSVGYGGLPNADGIVQLDASVMHGPRRRAGAVAALEGVRTPSLVAKAVLEHTDHHLIVGADARRFARQHGFEIEDDLTTERSRALWLEWKRRSQPELGLDPQRRSEAGLRAGLSMARDGLIDSEHFWGTIHCSAIGARGEICGVTSTSGLAWKIPGRVGDSPILGAGLYLDNDVGAVGSTGRGEANLYNLSSFLVVENLRRGMNPRDAAFDACRRIRRNTVEPRLLNSRGLPRFNVVFYVLDARGQYAGVALYQGPSIAICDENGGRLERCEALLEGTEN